MRLVPATSRRDLSHRVNWQLVPESGQLHRVNWPFLLQNLVPATSSTNLNQFEFVGLVAGTKLRLDFVATMASSHDATSPCDLLQGLVAGTSPIVSADLKNLQMNVHFPFGNSVWEFWSTFQEIPFSRENSLSRKQN